MPVYPIRRSNRRMTHVRRVSCSLGTGGVSVNAPRPKSHLVNHVRYNYTGEVNATGGVCTIVCPDEKSVAIVSECHSGTIPRRGNIIAVQVNDWMQQTKLLSVTN